MKLNTLLKTSCLSLALAMAMGLTACQTVSHTTQNSAPFKLQLDQQNIELAAAPKTIAVYDLAALDTLHALGVPVQIVPQSTYKGALSRYAAEDIIKAGSLFEPELERLKTAKPDLIIVGGRSANQADRLKAIAPVVHFTATEHANTVETLSARTHSLAAAFGKTAEANLQLERIQQLQKNLKVQTQGKSALMLFAVGENFMPHAENDRFGFVYEFSGLTPAISRSETTDAPRPAADSPEALALQKLNAQRLQQALEQQPDYLIVLDRGAVNTGVYASKDTILKHPLLSQSKAVKENRVIFVDADQWYLVGLGLQNSQDMLQTLLDATK